MTDTPNLDQVIQEITELTNTIKEHGLKDPTIDYERLEAKFAELLKQQQEALMATQPVRRGDDGDSEPVSDKALAGYKGKYVTEVRDIARHGVHKFGNWHLKAVDLFLAKELIDRANGLKEQKVAFQGAEKIRPASEDLVNAVKLLTSTGSGIGDEYVPNNMAAELWTDFFAASQIVNDLPGQPMPSDPFDMPLGLGDVTWRKGGQGAAVAAQNPATAKSILTSTEQIAEVDWTYNLDEDAIIAIMPALRQRLGISGGEQMDAFVLNADGTATATGNINSDDGTPAADSYYLSEGQDGIRHLYLVDNTAQSDSAGGDALADADMVKMLNHLDKYGLDLGNVRIVPGIAAYFSMVGLTNVATVDKYGPQATIVKGELARYRGVPVLPSASQPKGEADGKLSVTAASNTLGTISAYNRNAWRVGFRRGLLVEVDRNIQTRQLIMVVSFRIAVAAHGTRSSATHTAGVYNILV